MKKDSERFQEEAEKFLNDHHCDTFIGLRGIGFAILALAAAIKEGSEKKKE